ncbi:hypothetical protein SAMN05421595_0055 [Austwickia chelonae]|uniref:Transmembrane protein n=1 Tax=Austwickia chelonae NBRC 105200 TaxID=1184607 RepID=K6VQ16_9MICO|nr:hypothetical protein [Austwickia chelonae]GAB78844.1 hypothetical protein AUCHE_17_00560 [Austwickia chelonae NBRC 105200]SEV85191.1 hypothetical protein SAMN05421595_0055 [Austwickia chelonae]
MSNSSSDLPEDRPSGNIHEFFRPTSAAWRLSLTACVICWIALLVAFGPLITQAKVSLLSFLPFHVATGLFFWAVLQCDPYRARTPRLIRPPHLDNWKQVSPSTTTDVPTRTAPDRQTRHSRSAPPSHPKDVM